MELEEGKNAEFWKVLELKLHLRSGKYSPVHIYDSRYITQLLIQYSYGNIKFKSLYVVALLLKNITTFIFFALHCFVFFFSEPDI